MTGRRPDPGTVFYRLVRQLFWILARPMFRFRVEGAERMPERGPAVVVAPHRSWLDPACVGAACRPPVRFLIRDHVFDKRWARWFYRGMRSIPLTPGPGRSTLALREALRHLQRGGWIGVFPEGTVVGEGERVDLHPGAAMLAVRTGATVIPMTIEGSAAAWPRGRRLPRRFPVRLVVGQPIVPPHGRGREATARLLGRIERALVEPARGNG